MPCLGFVGGEAEEGAGTVVPAPGDASVLFFLEEVGVELAKEAGIEPPELLELHALSEGFGGCFSHNDHSFLTTVAGPV